MLVPSPSLKFSVQTAEHEATGQVGKGRKVKLEGTKGWETDLL